jgi:hypothetical protein
MPPSNLQMWPKYVVQQIQMPNDLFLCLDQQYNENLCSYEHNWSRIGNS